MCNVSKSQTFRLFCWSTETSRRLGRVTAKFMIEKAEEIVSRDGEVGGAVDWRSRPDLQRTYKSGPCSLNREGSREVKSGNIWTMYGY